MDAIDEDKLPVEVEYIEESNSVKGIDNKHKQRFPILTGKLLQQAINEDLLSYDKKDTIIRDPNIHTILQIKFDVSSPRLSQAIKQCRLVANDLKVEEYEDRYDRKAKPLQNLIAYLHYITTKYKLLNKVLKTRNQIKQKEKLEKKIVESKDFRYQSERSAISAYDTIQEGSTIILTEVPQQSKFFRLSKQDSSFTKEAKSGADSFLARSVMSQEDRKNKFLQKQEAEDKNFKRFFDMAVKHLEDKEQFYSKLPEQITKATNSREQYLEKIRSKMTKFNKQVDKVQMENQKRKEQFLEKYPTKIQMIEENLQRHIDKKNKRINEQMTSISEQKKQQEQLEEERELRRLYYQQEEDEFINEILGRLETKQNHLEEYMLKKQYSQEQKVIRFQENLEKKQTKVKELLQKMESDTIKDYVDRESGRQMQLMKYEQRLLQGKRDLSLKHLRQLRKVEKKQNEIEQRQLESLETQLDRKQERVESVLKRHSSLVEIRKIKMIQKNQIRQQQSKVNYLNSLLVTKQRHDEIIQRNLEVSLSNTHKKVEMQELEKLKMEQLQEQGQRRYEMLHSQKF